MKHQPGDGSRKVAGYIGAGAAWDVQAAASHPVAQSPAIRVAFSVAFAYAIGRESARDGRLHSQAKEGRLAASE